MFRNDSFILSAVLLFGDVCDKSPVISVPTEANAPFMAVCCCHHWSCPQLLAIIQRTTNPLTNCNLTKTKRRKYFFWYNRHHYRLCNRGWALASSVFLGFVTIFFLRSGVVSLTPNPQLGGHHPWPAGMGGLTSSIGYRHHSSRDHMTTQTPTLRQTRDTFVGFLYPLPPNIRKNIALL